MASGSFERDLRYCAWACATRRTLPKVKSSAITPRQPSVPNLIWVGIEVLKVTGLAGALERLDDLANVLRARPRNDQQRVFRVDDDHVLQPDSGDQAPVSEHKASARVDQHSLALDRVAVGVRMYAVAKLGPAADVGPIERRRHQEQPVGLFHDAAIDHLVGQTSVELRRLSFVACAPRFEDLAQTDEVAGRVLRKLPEKDLDPPREPGKVPVVAALFEKTGRGAGVGLFFEALDPSGPQRSAAGRVDVTKPGRRKGRLEAEEHQV